MIQKHKIVVLLISLLAAVVFWIYVVTTVAPDTTGSVNGITVTVTGDTTLEARNLMITELSPETVRVDLQTSRATLSKLNSGNVFAYVDVSNITEAGDLERSYTITFPDTVNSGDISILRKSVDTIHISISEISTKTLPVELQWDGQVQDGYLFDTGEVEFEPANITLRGPDFEVDPVERIVVYYDVSELTQTTKVTTRLVFLDGNGAEVTLSELTKVSAEETVMTLPVQQLKDIDLSVELSYGPGITSENVSVILDPASIRVSGPSDVVEALSETFTLGSIDLTKAEDGETFEYNITLPKDVKNISGDSSVTATVKFTGLTYRSYTATDIDLLNVPEDYEVALSTRAVTVRLRGSKSLLDAIEADQIHVRADLTDITQSGTYTVKASVEIDGRPDVGVIGDVELIITLS